MMYQLVTIKKDQQSIFKKNELDRYLPKTKTIGLDVDRKVNLTTKDIPTALPANLNKIYDIFSIDINK